MNDLPKQWMDHPDIRQMLESRIAETTGELRRQNEALRGQNQRLRMALESGGIGIWEWDPKTNASTWDELTRAMYGASNDVPGQANETWSASLAPEDAPRVLALVDATVRAGGSFCTEFRICRPDGASRHILGTGRFVRDAGGDLLFGLGTSQDITGRKATEAELHRHRHHLEELVAERTTELEHAKLRAEAASHAKSVFLANVSHEVRTPMNGVLGIAEILEQTALTPQQREWVGLLKDSGQALMRLLNDVLDLSKIEADRLALETAPFDPRRELAEAARLAAMSTGKKTLEIRWQAADAVPARVVGDAFRLRQIMLNLLGNAVKFTDQGRVEAQLALEERTVPGRVRLRLSVADTGIGVSEQQLARLFAPFMQGDASITRKYGGSGLGLVICVRLAEKMNGRIWGEPRPEGGSVFHAVCEFAEHGEPAAA